MAKFARRRSRSFRTLYRAVVDLCRQPLEEGVAATQADRYVKRYPSGDFALALIFHFILSCHFRRFNRVSCCKKICVKPFSYRHSI